MGKDYSITFIGDGPSRIELEKMTKDLNLEKYVRFMGNISNDWINNNLCNYDLFIQASLYEGFGLTALEAMGAKVPTILSNIEGHLEVTDNGKYSFLFNVNDHQNLALKIIEVSNKHQILKEYTENAYKYVSNMFTIEKQVSRLDEIYFGK